MWRGISESQGDGDVKRRLLIVVIFLLAGAVVNVAVAWGFAAWVNVVADMPNKSAMTSSPSRIPARPSPSGRRTDQHW